MKKIILFSFILAYSFCVQAQDQEVIWLYKGKAPGTETWNWQEGSQDNKTFNTKIVYNVTQPSLTVVKPDPTKANGTAVVVCPGGGFQLLSINSEGFDVANWLAAKGVTVFVLKYRLFKSETNDPAMEMMAKIQSGKTDSNTMKIIGMGVSDGKKAIEYVRANAAKYNINPSRVGIIGFSAGGTVAASAAFGYTKENRPDFVAPIYAYFPPNNQPVGTDAMPMFLVAATNDQFGLAPNSISLYTKWVEAKHSAELHLYSTGGHGFGMRKQNLPSDSWIERFGDWLEIQGLLKK
jgi:acetyl esterase/lipase